MIIIYRNTIIKCSRFINQNNNDHNCAIAIIAYKHINIFIKIYDKQFIYFKIINVNLNYVQLIINNINEYEKLVSI